MKFHLYGLCGYAGTGKDTVADLLCTHLGFRKFAFADTLRAEVAEAFGVDRIYFTSQHTKNVPMAALMMERAPHGFVGAVALTVDSSGRNARGQLSEAWMTEPRTPRQIMQWWGTEYRRRQSSLYWVNALAARIFEHRRAGNDRIVITDCRFANEVDLVRAYGGQLWQVTRPGVDGGSTPERGHVSATDGTEFEPDAVIANLHDIRHLQQLVLTEFLARETGISTVKVSLPAEA
jgi:hypothetical protein